MSTATAAASLVLLTGVSGSGKSVALAALEDAGHYCVDNLPPQLLPDLVAARQAEVEVPLAVSVDARSGDQLAQLPGRLAELKARGVAVQVVFLEASTEVLLRRYTETRRLHPLSRLDGGGSNQPARMAL
ncbi:MAG: RNase adapter RapZ, partial [Burkholderiaceae bacterium]